jgi:hypothetical protein
VARDPDTIQREIEQARTALAESLDVLSERASPRRLADTGRQRVQSRLEDPRIRYGLIAVGVLIAAAVLRKMFR